MDAGAWYKPFEMLPTLGEMLQVTLGFDVPLRDALNCMACPADKEADGGLTATETDGIRVTTADADLLVSAALVAVTVMDCWAATCAGAI